MIRVLIGWEVILQTYFITGSRTIKWLLKTVTSEKGPTHTDKHAKEDISEESE